MLRIFNSIDEICIFIFYNLTTEVASVFKIEFRCTFKNAVFI